MVKASFNYDREAGTMEMRMQGHADFAKLGKDPVCAGASVVGITLAQCVDMLNEIGAMEEKPTIRISGGNVRVQCMPRPEHLGTVTAVFWEAQVGMRLLAAAYPENASVTTFETADADSIKESSTSRTE